MTSFSLRRFALLCLRVANLTFGGGEPTMSVFFRELVVSRNWLTRERYALIYSLARATPGTNILAFCAGVGWEVARWRGALVAVLSSSVPCAAAVVWFTYAYTLWRSNPLAMSAIGGTYLDGRHTTPEQWAAADIRAVAPRSPAASRDLFRTHSCW